MGTPSVSGPDTPGMGTPSVSGPDTPGMGTPSVSGPDTPGMGTPSVSGPDTPGMGTPIQQQAVREVCVALRSGGHYGNGPAVTAPWADPNETQPPCARGEG
ncbi:hypothetical protein ACOMHN_062963 [Nucella lapillus]